MEERASKGGDTGKTGSWWGTLPGVLTALAAVITAITGLVVALRPSDAPVREADTRSAVAVEQPDERAPLSATNASQPNAPQSNPQQSNAAVLLPSGMEVRLARGDAVIRVLSARLAPFNREKRSLVFSVRHTNNGRYPVNFWTASYRLLVEDVPAAPTNDLNEVVEGKSAKEGEVAFEVPLETTRVTLRISAGDEQTDIPFVLPAAQP